MNISWRRFTYTSSGYSYSYSGIVKKPRRIAPSTSPEGKKGVFTIVNTGGKVEVTSATSRKDLGIKYNSGGESGKM